MFLGRELLNMLSDIREVATQTLSTMSCSSTASVDTTCRDDSEALTLKLITIGSILISSVIGVSIPLIGSSRSRDRSSGGFSSNLFITVKAFAAGVMLATGFVHIMPDASSNLTNSCLPSSPWSKFPFAGFIAMCSAFLTLLLHSVGTQIFYESKGKEAKFANDMDKPVRVGLLTDDDPMLESSGNGESGRQALVAQVLELGIVSHSVLIGLSVGVSHSPCVIQPLIVALSFHQFFEGFALGGCIAEAKFGTLKTVLTATFFALTTPSGIGIGISIASSYDANSARALLIEGILDAVSAGILIYMSLVDLIAADFMTKKMRCNVRLQIIVSFFALFMGATLMSLLAIWS